MSVIHIDYDESAKIPEKTYAGVGVSFPGKDNANKKSVIYFTGDVVADYTKAVSEHPDAMLSSDVDHFVMDSKSFRFNSKGMIVLNKGVIAKPKPIEYPQFANAKFACQEYVDAVESGVISDDELGDYENGIFEACLKAVYGDNVFEWVNSRK